MSEPVDALNDLIDMRDAELATLRAENERLTLARDNAVAAAGANHLAKIEALTKLRCELGTKTGKATRLTIGHAIKELAKQVVKDEKANRLSQQQSRIVRCFVRGLKSHILEAKCSQPDIEEIAAN